MRIKRLDITGFKSFPERVQVAFLEGISAVVGPNGCGKSNIVDAIRWVMGEQSPKQLRGRQMEDVIFNGAKTHDPSGLAEVTMTLANENSGGPTLGPSEISITRRLYRSGDSEYLINKVPCRLKDIVQFFMDTGMGTKAYAIIEQGRIGAMVDARPEERRALIDEAAGITRYKAQKKEAERKIEATEQNLTHIGTLMSETKRQINSLTRAAAKAAKYKEIKTELQRIDLAISARELADLDRRQAERASEQNQANTNLLDLTTRLETKEVELEGTRLSVLSREKEAEEKAQALYQLQNESDKLHQEDQFLANQAGEIQGRRQRLSTQIESLTEQANGKSEEVARLEEELADLMVESEEKKAALSHQRQVLQQLKHDHQQAANRQGDLNRRLSAIRTRTGRLEEALAAHDRLAQSHAVRREELERDLSHFQAESSKLNEQISVSSRRKEELTWQIEDGRAQAREHRAQRDRLKAQAEELAKEIRRLEAELAGLSSRLKTLKDVKANFGWYPAAVKALMSDPDRMAKGIVGPVAERLMVPEGFESAVEAALGERVKYILVADRTAAARALAFLKESRLGRCGFISLADLGDLAKTDLTQTLLGEYLTVQTLDQALSVEPHRPVLTKEGDYFGPDGIVVGGRTNNGDRGLLAQLKDLELLESQIEALDLERERLSTTRDDVLGQINEIESLITQAEEATRVAQTALMEVEKGLSAINGRQGEIGHRQTSTAKALAQLNDETKSLNADSESALAEKEALKAEELELTADLETVTELFQRLSADLEATRDQEQEASLAAAELTQRHKTSERELTRTQEWLADIQGQIEAKEQDLAEAGLEDRKIVDRRQDIAAAWPAINDRLAQAHGSVAVAKTLVDEARALANTQEAEARRARRQKEDLSEQIRKLELDLQEISFLRQEIIKRIENDYHLNLVDLPLELRPLAGPDDPPLDADEARQQRQELKAKLEGLGEVNLTAIGEHEALLERYNFYKDQYDDLTSAINNLKSSISKINRTCRIRFSSTFAEVDQKLREIFPLLFEGGEAWLSLTDESNILDSGVEIHVHPPGKKLTVMSLLSGGEKALVALALIFALYLIKPSPFCLLDETDAPLDEANIDRFNRLLMKLGQSSQIIMVTHNKRTMQIAHTLYGVTMEEPGCSKMVSATLSQVEELQKNVQMVQAG